MIAIVTESPKERSSERSTLGEILYPNNDKTHVSEAEWVGLVERIGAGDQVALRGLYERTHRIVFTLMVRIVGNRETAEELTVDVFYDLWRRASSYNPADGTVFGWIMNQARCRAIDRLRFEHRRKRVRDGSAELLITTAWDDPQQTCQLAEQGRLLGEALVALTPHEREAIEIAYFSESTYREVALKLNVPLGTVKTRIRSGLAKLRAALELKGI
jgi:RNA polymerase sigma-70 factor (ECF subfamily)